MPTELNLHLILESPPAGIDFGLQKGSGPYVQGKRLEHFFYIAPFPVLPVN